MQWWGSGRDAQIRGHWSIGEEAASWALGLIGLACVVGTQQWVLGHVWYLWCSWSGSLGIYHACLTAPNSSRHLEVWWSGVCVVVVVPPKDTFMMFNYHLFSHFCGPKLKYGDCIMHLNLIQRLWKASVYWTTAELFSTHVLKLGPNCCTACPRSWLFNENALVQVLEDAVQRGHVFAKQPGEAHNFVGGQRLLQF